MAGVPAKSGEAYTFYFSVTSQANTNIFQANPTIAAGDFQYSNDGGATYNNPATIPAVCAGNNKRIRAMLSGPEMTPSVGDKIDFIGSDQVGAEWQDYSREITVTTQNVDDLSTLTQAQILSDVTPFAGANIDATISSRSTLTQAQILSDATPFAGANVDQALSTTEANIRGADNDDLQDISDQIDALNDPSVADIADGVWDEAEAGHTAAGSFGARFTACCTQGPGSEECIYTLTSDVDGSPIEAANVWVTTDAAGTVVIASGLTDASGQITFWLDVGTYYVWRSRDGYTFTNPDVEVVT